MRRRKGGVTLELLINLPVWIIALLAIIEFGELLSGLQQVSLAARVGAEEASQTGAGSLSTHDYDPVPSNIVEVIDHQLQSAGIVASASQRGVILEHNVGASYVILASGTYPPPSGTPPPYLAGPALPTMGHFVRITVFVRMTRVVPNLLGSWGYDASGRFVWQMATFRYELLL